MLCGKVVQLLEGLDKDGFEVFYGSDAEHDIRELNFCKIAYNDSSPEATKTYIREGYLIGNVIQGAKEILILNGELSRKDKEEILLVIIPKSTQLITTSKRILGRDSDAVILEMHAGDLLEASNGTARQRELYMAVQADNEMFLIKKNR